MTDALRAKEWINANTSSEVDDVRPDGLGLPPGVSLNRHWFILHSDGIAHYWDDRKLIAFARSKGFEGGEDK